MSGVLEVKPSIAISPAGKVPSRSPSPSHTHTRSHAHSHLGEDEVDVDPHGQRDHGRQHPERQGVGVFPSQDQEAGGAEDDGGAGAGQYGGHKPGGDDGDHPFHPAVWGPQTRRR